MEPSGRDVSSSMLLLPGGSRRLKEARQLLPKQRDQRVLGPSPGSESAELPGRRGQDINLKLLGTHRKASRVEVTTVDGPCSKCSTKQGALRALGPHGKA